MQQDSLYFIEEIENFNRYLNGPWIDVAAGSAIGMLLPALICGNGFIPLPNTRKKRQTSLY